jgi:hypothetical protein
MKQFLAVAVIAALLAGGAIFLGHSEAPLNMPPTAQQPAPPAVLPVKIVLECTEAAELSDNKDGFLLMRKSNSTEGHEIKFIQVTPDWPKDIKDLFAAPPADKLPGKAVYEFEVHRDDTYYLDLRARWVNTCGNSVWVKIDNGDYCIIKDQFGEITKSSYSWEWHQVVQGNEPKGFALKPGRHKLTMSVRQNGPALHRWVITTEASKPAAADEE